MEPLLQGFKPYRLESNDDEKVKSNPIKIASDDNACIWHTEISGDANQRLAAQYLAKNIRHTEYSVFDSDGDKKLDKKQEDFLLQNQMQVEEFKDGKGETSYVYKKQSQPDEKITKGEVNNMLNLRRALTSVTPKDLNEEEKAFIKGFDATFGEKGVPGSKTFEGDYSNKYKANIFKLNAGFTAGSRPKELSKEKDIPVKGKDGAIVLMSEEECYGNLDKTLVPTGETKMIEAKYTFLDSKYQDVDKYMAKLPADAEKGIARENGKLGKKAVKNETREFVNFDYSSPVVQNYFNKKDEIAKIEKIKNTDANPAGAHFYLAGLYEQQKDFKGALDNYKACLSLNCSPEDKAKIQDKVTQLTEKLVHPTVVNDSVMLQAQE